MSFLKNDTLCPLVSTLWQNIFSDLYEMKYQKTDGFFQHLHICSHGRFLKLSFFETWKPCILSDNIWQKGIATVQCAFWILIIPFPFSIRKKAGSGIIRSKVRGISWLREGDLKVERGYLILLWIFRTLYSFEIF